MYLSPSAGAMRPVPAASSPDAVTSVRHRNSELFNVETSGHRNCELLLFPGDDGVVLTQSPADATQYERQFYEMRPEEQLAIRQWTATDQDEGGFGDYEAPLHRQGIPDFNYDLNKALAAGGSVKEEHQDMCERLSFALQKLPPLRGEYLRIATYPDQDAMPWGSAIRVGDTVTNFPCFMSASADSTYADETGPNETDEVVVRYKINSSVTTTAIPLWRGTASLANELEFLYPRDSCFIVKGISVARRMEETEDRINTEVGVLLEQVPFVARAKNLYTGTPVVINTQTEQRPLQRTSREVTPQHQGHTPNSQIVNYVTEMKYDLPEAERFRPLGSAKRSSLPLQREAFRPEQFALPGTALQAIHGLALAASENPAAAVAAVMERQRDGAHIGLRLAGLMNKYPRAAVAPLKAYLDLLDALHATGHLRPEQVQSLLLPEIREESHLPVSAAVASHWRSGVAQSFVITLANSTPDSAEKKAVRSRLRLEQLDQHHPQMQMRYPADFYKQIKRGMKDLPADGQNTPALQLLAEHGLIPPERELGRIVKKLPAVAPRTASPMRTMREIAMGSDDVMPAVLAQEAEQQKQDAELEKARAIYQENWQAVQRERETRTSSPAASLIAGLSNQLHVQGVALRAQKRLGIARQEQAQAIRRRQDRQKPDWVPQSEFTALMRAGLVVAPARSSVSAGKETEYALPQESRPAGQREEQLREEQLREVQRAIGRRVAQDAAKAAANRHYLDTREMLSHASDTSTLPVPSDPAPAQTHGQRVAVAEYLDESGQPRSQAR